MCWKHLSAMFSGMGGQRRVVKLTLTKASISSCRLRRYRGIFSSGSKNASSQALNSSQVSGNPSAHILNPGGLYPEKRPCSSASGLRSTYNDLQHTYRLLIHQKLLPLDVCDCSVHQTTLADCKLLIDLGDAISSAGISYALSGTCLLL